MTLSIPRAFDAFARAILPDAKRRERADNVQRHLRSQLGHHLPGLRETFITGSIARSTAIAPIGDVDVFVVLDPSVHPRSTPPKATLRTLQRALQKALGSSATVRLQTRSVRVIHGTHDIPLDLVPAIPDPQGGHAIPDRDRDAWIVTDPRLHKTRLDEADRHAGSKLRPLIRMARAARAQGFPKLGSYHLEAMACRVMLPAPRSFDVGIRDLLAGLAEQVIQRIPDPSGRGPAIHLDLDARTDLQRRLRDAHATAERAIAHAAAGRLPEAHAQWRHLFGPRWPG